MYRLLTLRYQKDEECHRLSFSFYINNGKEQEFFIVAQFEEINIDQGTDLALEIHLINATDGAKKDLTNYSVSAALKRGYNADSANTTMFSGIISDTTNGIVTLELTNTQTSGLVKGRYVYDVQISHIDSSGDTIIERVLEGTATVSPSVT